MRSYNIYRDGDLVS